MPVTVAGTQVTFNDSTVQTTAFNTAAVLTATAGASLAAVGTYALLGDFGTSVFNPGSTYSGSILRYSGADNSGFVPSGSAVGVGTWRAMGYGRNNGYNSASTVFLRIA